MLGNCNPTVQRHIPEDLHNERGICNDPLVQYEAIILSYWFAVDKFTCVFLCLSCPVTAKCVWEVKGKINRRMDNYKGN